MPLLLSHPAPEAPLSGRRIDLDWIRVSVFGLLIVYHIGMVYVSWSFHVKSTHILPGLEPLMLLVNPWRLGLLFLVSGVATRYMASRIQPGALTKMRSSRLLLPLLAAMIVVVPPQAYLQAMQQAGYTGSFAEFYLGPYFRLGKHFCNPGPCIILPTYNHLWFVLYLWVYTMLAVAFLWGAPRLLARLEQALRRDVTPWALLVLPALYMIVCRWWLQPRFPQSHALVDDWYNHAEYFALFAVGFLAAGSPSIWRGIERARWAALIIAALAYAVFITARQMGADFPLAGTTAGGVLRWALYGLYQWAAIVAILGFGKRWLTKDSPVLRYLTDAVFPYYIIHQTAIIAAAFWLRDAGLPFWAEASLVLLATVASCALGYDLVRRFGWLRPWFGLKRLVTGAPTGAVAQA
ncbi:MAG TPA: acyltransferase family protein [bacterium]